MYYNIEEQYDGFGAQYQKIIQTYCYCKLNNMEYAYRPLRIVEHNYKNEEDYVNKLENFINLKSKLPNIEPDMNIYNIDYRHIRSIFEEDMDKSGKSDAMQFIKDCFWENKSRDFFKNGKINIAVHIRRHNSHDNRIEGANTPDNYYLNVLNNIRQKYKGNELCFHIYSQGHIDDFNCYINNDVILHINEDIITTFIGLVSAEILVMSASSFSYAAALISDGEIYYLPFWHNPCSNWIII
jgi:hypothetical protein